MEDEQLRLVTGVLLTERGEDQERFDTDCHEFFHLSPLHSLLELFLLRGIEAVDWIRALHIALRGSSAYLSIL